VCDRRNHTGRFTRCEVPGRGRFPRRHRRQGRTPGDDRHDKPVAADPPPYKSTARCLAQHRLMTKRVSKLSRASSTRSTSLTVLFNLAGLTSSSRLDLNRRIDPAQPASAAAALGRLFRCRLHRRDWRCRFDNSTKSRSISRTKPARRGRFGSPQPCREHRGRPAGRAPMPAGLSGFAYGSKSRFVGVSVIEGQSSISRLTFYKSRHQRLHLDRHRLSHTV